LCNTSQEDSLEGSGIEQQKNEPNSPGKINKRYLDGARGHTAHSLSFSEWMKWRMEIPPTPPSHRRKENNNF
jgi:hypothetical protein